MKRDLSNKVKIETDPFEGSVKLTWIRVGGYIKPYDPNKIAPIGGVILNSDKGQDLIFSFENHDSKDYIVFFFFLSHYRLLQNDKVHFRFDQESTLNFSIDNKPQRFESSWDGLYKVKVPITLKELDVFKIRKITDWKIELISKKKTIISGAKHFYWYKGEDLNLVVNNLAQEYTEIVKREIPNHKPFNPRDTECQKLEKSCFIYLMIDTTNNFYKIGISNNPVHREKTLQSEKPTIELLAFKEYPNRRIALTIEKSLHKLYKSKRIRGEWFELTSENVGEITKTLN